MAQQNMIGVLGQASQVVQACKMQMAQVQALHPGATEVVEYAEETASLAADVLESLSVLTERMKELERAGAFQPPPEPPKPAPVRHAPPLRTTAADREGFPEFPEDETVARTESSGRELSADALTAVVQFVAADGEYQEAMRDLVEAKNALEGAKAGEKKTAREQFAAAQNRAISAWEARVEHHGFLKLLAGEAAGQ